MQLVGNHGGVVSQCVCIYIYERERGILYIYMLTCPHFRHIPSSKEPAGNGLLWLRRQSCTTSQESAAKCCKGLANSHLWSAEFTKSGNLRRNTSKHSTHRPGNGRMVSVPSKNTKQLRQQNRCVGSDEVMGLGLKHRIPQNGWRVFFCKKFT